MSAVVRAFAGLITAATACGLVACTHAPDPRYPAQPVGCDVAVYHDAPTVAADNVGTVHAECDERTSDEDCLRELKDQVCKLGGDIVWGVPVTSKELAHGERSIDGRAAHTHVGGRRFGAP